LLDFCYFAIVGSLRQALYLSACNINFFGKLIVNNLTRQLLVQLPTGFKKVERENPFNLFTKKGSKAEIKEIVGLSPQGQVWRSTCAKFRQ
jgi:hypothetical protein